MSSVEPTMEELNSKQQKLSSEDEEDRISSLPDGVLLNHILSRLPTKTVVSTSHLSRRWRHLWHHLQVLDFNEDFFLSGYVQNDIFIYDNTCVDRLRSFAVLVNNVLALLCNPRGIRKMRLHCAHSALPDKSRAYSVDTWVRAAIGPHLEELHLNLCSDHDGPGFRLPLSIFSCPNLVSLSICGQIDAHLQSSTTISLPSLKMMLIHLGNVEVPYVNALLCGCPNIESLELNFFNQNSDKVCFPPTLKRLKVHIQYQDGNALEINAPDLEYLNINQYTFRDVLNRHNLHNVVEAHLHLFPLSFDFVVPLIKLLSALSGTKHLLLGGSTTKWLLGEPRDLLFQEFRYLLRLELILPCVNSNSLLCLLQKCPMLQVLIIQNDKEQSPILGWATQPSVPKCLVSHLTFIQFKGFLGLPDEVSFVEYVLQKGAVLKTMIIDDISLDQSKKYDILKRLSNVPRASIMCRLAFD